MAKIVTVHLLINEDNSLDSAIAINDAMRDVLKDHPKVVDYAFAAIMRNGRRDTTFDYDPDTYEEGAFAHELKREVP